MLPTKQAEKKIVYESDLLRVIYYEAAGDDLFVPFGNLGEQARGATFWGDKYFAKRGISSLGFMPKGPTWFPPKDTLKAIESIAPILSRHPRIIGYGHSKGGYAAIKYSHALGSFVTIATAPQFSINPADVGSFDRRYAKNYDPKLHENMRIVRRDVSGHIRIVFDPTFDADRKHVEMIEKIYPIEKVIAPLFGHNVISSFVKGGSPDEILRALTSHSRNGVHRAREILRQRRRGMASYFARAAHVAQARGRKYQAYSLIREAAQLEPENGEYLIRLAGSVLKLGRIEQAKMYLQDALKAPDRSTAFWNMAAICFRGLRQHEEAAAAMEMCIALAPLNRAFYNAAVTDYTRAGRPADAQRLRDATPQNKSAPVAAETRSLEVASA